MADRSRRVRWIGVVVVLASFTALAACSDDDGDDAGQQGDGVLEDIKEHGSLRCGTPDTLPGFAVLTPAGEHVGFDADFCRVIAAAVLGDATKVTFVDVATENRFTALQSGEIDVLVRNTTWTAEPRRQGRRHTSCTRRSTTASR